MSNGNDLLGLFNDIARVQLDVARAGMAPKEPVMNEPDEGIDWDDLDEIIQDAVCNDEGRLGSRSLLYYLNKRGWTISRMKEEQKP